MFAFELQFLKWLESIRTGFLTALFEGITILGEETLVILLVVALWFAVDSKLARKVFFVTICSTGLNGVVKNIAQVPRPFDKGIMPVRQETATGFSFPIRVQRRFEDTENGRFTYRPYLGCGALLCRCFGGGVYLSALV